MLCDRAVIFAILVISLQIPWLYAIQCTVEPADVVEVPPQGKNRTITRIEMLAGGNLTIRCKHNKEMKFDKQTIPHRNPCLKGRINITHTKYNETAYESVLHFAFVEEHDSGQYDCNAPDDSSPPFPAPNSTFYLNIAFNPYHHLSHDYLVHHEAKPGEICTTVEMNNITCHDQTREDCRIDRWLPAWTHLIIVLLIIAVLIGLLTYCGVSLCKYAYRIVKAENTYRAPIELQELMQANSEKQTISTELSAA